MPKIKYKFFPTKYLANFTAKKVKRKKYTNEIQFNKAKKQQNKKKTKCKNPKFQQIKSRKKQFSSLSMCIRVVQKDTGKLTF